MTDRATPPTGSNVPTASRISMFRNANRLVTDTDTDTANAQREGWS